MQIQDIEDDLVPTDADQLSAADKPKDGKVKKTKNKSRRTAHKRDSKNYWENLWGDR